MIDLAGRSLTEIDARIERVATELDSLNVLRAAWERYLALTGAFIDTSSQEGSPASAVDPGATTAQAAARHAQPAPALDQHQCPDCERRFATPHALVIHRSRMHGVTSKRADNVESRQERERARQSRSDGAVRCPDCGKEVKAMGLGTHRRQAHGRGRPTTLVKPPPDAPPKPSRESFLCDRCDVSFPTADELRAHRRPGTCQRTPTRPPWGRQPLQLPVSPSAGGSGE